MRYCGSKHDHKPHSWQQIGRPHGPIFTCPGKPVAEIPLHDPMQLELIDQREAEEEARLAEEEARLRDNYPLGDL